MKRSNPSKQASKRARARKLLSPHLPAAHIRVAHGHAARHPRSVFGLATRLARLCRISLAPYPLRVPGGDIPGARTAARATPTHADTTGAAAARGRGGPAAGAAAVRRRRAPCRAGHPVRRAEGARPGMPDLKRGHRSLECHPWPAVTGDGAAPAHRFPGNQRSSRRRAFQGGSARQEEDAVRHRRPAVRNDASDAPTRWTATHSPAQPPRVV